MLFNAPFLIINIILTIILVAGAIKICPEKNARIKIKHIDKFIFKCVYTS